MKNINVAVIGASGYTGLELLKILIPHRYFHINYIATSEGGMKLSELHPSLQGIFEFDVSAVNIDEIAEKSELVFLALPHKTAMEIVKELMRFDHIKIVDLSADYRLQKDTYEKFYVPHIDSENLEDSVYGLPELYREKIKKARLVANPGCYPTATILGAVPFGRYKTVGSDIIVDAKSGVSGAGKKCSTNTHYVTINDNMFAYSPMSHRHAPEIEEKLGENGWDNFSVQFVPHLVPATRGMLSSIYIQVLGEFDAIETLQEFYKDEPFIRIRETPPTMKDVAGTNYCDIFAKRVGNTLFIESAIDNLLRGASSQAVANANLMMGLEESESLPIFAYVP